MDIDKVVVDNMVDRQEDIGCRVMVDKDCKMAAVEQQLLMVLTWLLSLLWWW